MQLHTQSKFSIYQNPLTVITNEQKRHKIHNPKKNQTDSR